MQISNIIEDTFQFIRDPFYLVSNKVKLNFFQFFKILVNTTTFCLFIGIILALISNFLLAKIGYNPSDNNFLSSFILDNPTLYVFLFVVIIGPLFEELSFRLVLSIKKIWILLGFCFFIGGYIVPFVVSNLNIDEDLIIKIQVGAGGLIFCGFLVSMWLINKDRLEGFVRKNFKFIVYFFSILFGIGHVFNYYNLQKVWFIFPILVLPQLFIGFVLGAIRTRYSFWLGYLVHAFYNFLSGLSLFLYAIFLGEEKTDLLLSNELRDSVDTITNSSQFLQASAIIQVVYFACFLVFISIIIEFYKNRLRPKNV